MIGFVTWLPFLYHHYYKGGQANHSCENMLKLLYAIQVVKKIFDK